MRADAKFGLRIRDSKPSDTLIPWMLMQPILCHPVEEKGSSSPRDGCFKCGGAHFNVTAMHARAQASNRLAKANRASHGPRVSAKERAKRTRDNPKGKSKGTKGANQGAKGLHKGTTSKN